MCLVGAAASWTRGGKTAAELDVTELAVGPDPEPATL